MTPSSSLHDPSPAALAARAEEIAGPEWAEWYLRSPAERWESAQRLWPEYLALGGSLDPEVDLQSPFWTAEEYAAFADGRL